MGIARELLAVAEARNEIERSLSVRVVGGNKNDVEVEGNQNIELVAEGKGFGRRALKGILGRLVELS